MLRLKNASKYLTIWIHLQIGACAVFTQSNGSKFIGGNKHLYIYYNDNN